LSLPKNLKKSEMTKPYLLFLSIILFVSCNSTTAPTAEEQISLDQLKKIMYQTAKPLFEPTIDGLVEAKPQNGLPWIVDEEKVNLSETLKINEDKIEVEVKERFGKQIIEAKYPLVEGNALNNNNISASLSSSNLKDKSGKTIKLKEEIETGYGSLSSSDIRNGKRVSQNIQYVAFSAEIDKGTDYKQPFKGTLDLAVTYNDNIKTLEISKEQVGKTLDFGGDKIEVIKIDGNRAVFNSTTLKASDYNVMNTKNGVQLGVNFAKRKELNLGMNAGSSTATLDKQAYLIFEANPTISEADFGNKIHDHVLQLIRDPNLQKDKITVSRQLGPIETLVLYKELEPQSALLKVSF
jgi:hypothetical protein